MLINDQGVHWPGRTQSASSVGSLQADNRMTAARVSCWTRLCWTPLLSAVRDNLWTPQRRPRRTRG